MIKINLLPVKKKKRAKKLPTFLLATIFLTIAACAIMAYTFVYFSSKLSSKKDLVAANEKKIAELAAKLKEVENFEKLNATFKKNKDVIEQLSKNKALPVKVVDEVSAVLPSGVWINSMEVKGVDVSLSCTGFTNTDVVNYVNNLKNSKLFTDVYLQESVQAQVSGFSVYSFKLVFKVKV